MNTTKKKLIGHYNYFGVRDNSKSIGDYYRCIVCLLFKWLNRRSQKRSYTWEEFNQMLKYMELPLPKIKVYI